VARPPRDDAPDVADTRPPSAADVQLSGHIFSVSAGMVGVCLTVIGLFRVVVGSPRADSVADNLLAADALLFLVACMLAYLALRSRDAGRARRLERAADGVFLVGLAMMVAVGGLVAYEII
jgi:multisubunit Na+/H+ antiporter MnhF subunit